MDLGPVTQRRLGAELWDGETILWCARPAGRRLTAQRLRSVLTVLAAAALAVTLLVLAGDELLAVVAAAVALFGLIRFALREWVGVRTLYVVTDRRIMSAGLGSTVSVKWISGRELKGVRLNVRPDGSGDLRFERYLTGSEQRAQRDWTATVFDDGAAMRGPGDLVKGVLDDPASQTFVGVPDVRAVFDLVRKTFGDPVGGRGGTTRS